MYSGRDVTGQRLSPDLGLPNRKNERTGLDDVTRPRRTRRGLGDLLIHFLTQSAFEEDVGR